MSPSILQREFLPSRTEVTVNTLVAESSTPVLVSFQAPWSQVMAPSLGRLAKAFAGQLRVVHVNIATHPELARRFKIRVVPTLLLFKGGVPIEFTVGIVPEHYLIEVVRKALGVQDETPKARGTHPSGQCIRKSQTNRSRRLPVRPRPARFRVAKLVEA